MTSLEDRKRHIALKLDRAKYHLSELEKELNEFLKKKPFKVAVKIDEQSCKPIYYVESVEPVPKLKGTEGLFFNHFTVLVNF